MESNIEAVDLVYLWVDGSDPVWQAKKNRLWKNQSLVSEINCEGRYANNDELRYSLRSVSQYAPWLHKIFIITDNQTPNWLDKSNPKIQLVDHTEFIPAECLPCFNSCLIEYFLSRIPGLSEHFLYANDDMFINKPVKISDFFTPEGFPIIRLTRKPFRRLRWFWREKIRKNPLKNYSAKIANASALVKEKYGIYYSGMPHHNIDAYRKSDCRRVSEEIMREEFLAGYSHHVRNRHDIQRVVYSYVALAEQCGKLCYVTDKDSMHVAIHKERHYSRLEKNKPLFFCMNDSEYAVERDRMRMHQYLEQRFSLKSAFEL